MRGEEWHTPTFLMVSLRRRAGLSLSIWVQASLSNFFVDGFLLFYTCGVRALVGLEKSTKVLNHDGNLSGHPDLWQLTGFNGPAQGLGRTAGLLRGGLQVPGQRQILIRRRHAQKSPFCQRSSSDAGILL